MDLLIVYIYICQCIEKCSPVWDVMMSFFVCSKTFFLHV